GFGFHAGRPALRPAHGAPHQVAGLWTEPARQPARRPGHARGELFMDAAARLVRAVLPGDSAVHVENAISDDGRTFFRGGLYDRFGLAGESALEPGLFALPAVGDRAQRGQRPDLDKGRRPLLSKYL